MVSNAGERHPLRLLGHTRGKLIGGSLGLGLLVKLWLMSVCCPARTKKTKTAGREPNQRRKHSRLFTKSGGKIFGPTGLQTRHTWPRVSATDKHLLFFSSPPLPGSKPAADWSVWRRRGWREASWCVLSRIRWRGTRGSPRRRPPPGPPPASCTPEPAPERREGAVTTRRQT